MILLNQIPEPVGIPVCHALNALAVALCDFRHFVLSGVGVERVAVAASHVCHVDAKDPQQAVSFLRREFAQGAEGSADTFVVFGHSAFIQAPGVRAAQHRHDADVGSEQVLQEDHLEFDRVLDGVTVIFHEGSAAGEGF